MHINGTQDCMRTHYLQQKMHITFMLSSEKENKAWRNPGKYVTEDILRTQDMFTNLTPLLQFTCMSKKLSPKKKSQLIIVPRGKF